MSTKGAVKCGESSDFFPNRLSVTLGAKVEANRGGKEAKKGRTMTECIGVQAGRETKGGKKCCRIIA